MNKDELIENLKNIKNAPLASLKDNATKNSSSEKQLDALLQYNAMMDNITIGTGTTTEIEIAGLTLKLRLLAASEDNHIRKEVIKLCRKDDVFDEWNQVYHTILLTLERALTESPFKTDCKNTLSRKDLEDYMVGSVLEELYSRYQFFYEMATRKAEEFTEEEIQALISIVKKKPMALTELNRPQLLIVSRYLLNYSLQLEKITKPELTS